MSLQILGSFYFDMSILVSSLITYITCHKSPSNSVFSCRSKVLQISVSSIFKGKQENINWCWIKIYEQLTNILANKAIYVFLEKGLDLWESG